MCLEVGGSFRVLYHELYMNQTINYRACCFSLAYFLTSLFLCVIVSDADYLIDGVISADKLAVGLYRMYGGRAAGLDRFKKAQSSEPFSVSANSSSKPSAQPGTKVVSHSSALPSQPQTSLHQVQPRQHVQQPHASHGAAGLEAAPLLGQSQQLTQVGGGQSTWKPPDWAIEPRPGVYYLEVLKDGQVLDRINLDRRRHIFGRQVQTCDFVLDHQSVSRQHAAVIPHKNGRFVHFLFILGVTGLD